MDAAFDELSDVTRAIAGGTYYHQLGEDNGGTNTSTREYTTVKRSLPTANDGNFREEAERIGAFDGKKYLEVNNVASAPDFTWRVETSEFELLVGQDFVDPDQCFLRFTISQEECRVLSFGTSAADLIEEVHVFDKNNVLVEHRSRADLVSSCVTILRKSNEWAGGGDGVGSCMAPQHNKEAFYYNKNFNPQSSAVPFNAPRKLGMLDVELPMSSILGLFVQEKPYLLPPQLMEGLRIRITWRNPCRAMSNLTRGNDARTAAIVVSPTLVPKPLENVGSFYIQGLEMRYKTASVPPSTRNFVQKQYEKGGLNIRFPSWHLVHSKDVEEGVTSLVQGPITTSFSNALSVMFKLEDIPLVLNEARLFDNGRANLSFMDDLFSQHTYSFIGANLSVSGDRTIPEFSTSTSEYSRELLQRQGNNYRTLRNLTVTNRANPHEGGSDAFDSIFDKQNALLFDISKSSDRRHEKEGVGREVSTDYPCDYQLSIFTHPQRYLGGYVTGETPPAWDQPNLTFSLRRRLHVYVETQSQLHISPTGTTLRY
jgi:hypothetical protein